MESWVGLGGKESRTNQFKPWQSQGSNLGTLWSEGNCANLPAHSLLLTVRKIVNNKFFSYIHFNSTKKTLIVYNKIFLIKLDIFLKLEGKRGVLI